MLMLLLLLLLLLFLFLLGGLAQPPSHHVNHVHLGICFVFPLHLISGTICLVSLFLRNTAHLSTS
jgi:hypothetical protein